MALLKNHPTVEKERKRSDSDGAILDKVAGRWIASVANKIHSTGVA